MAGDSKAKTDVARHGREEHDRFEPRPEQSNIDTDRGKNGIEDDKLAIFSDGTERTEPPDDVSTDDIMWAPGMAEDQARSTGPGFGTGSLILFDGDEHGTSPWPRFAPGLAGLGQSTEVGFKLFARLREEKRSLVELGIVEVDRQIGDRGREAGSSVPIDGVEDHRRPGLDRGEIRRLNRALGRGSQERVDAARELEEAVATRTDAAAVRLLGEAYLRMNRRDEAAVQFRRAVDIRLQPE